MEQKKSVAVSLSPGLLILVGVVVGIILLVIGVGVGDHGNEGVFLAGLAVTTLSFFAGGFLLHEENNVVRLGLFLAGAIILGYLLTNGAVLPLVGNLYNY